MRAALLLALVAGGCQERPASDGSSLEGPLGWQAEARRAGEALDERLFPGSEELPADTASVTLLAAGEGELALAVTDRDGRTLVDARDPEGSPNRMLHGHALAVAMLPSASASLPLVPAYRVAPVGAGTVTVSAWVKRASGGRQHLPLAVIVVGAVVDDDHLDRALGEVGRIWRAAGVEIDDPARLRQDTGDLARVEIDPALGSDSPMLGQALALSSAAPAGALTLVVVGDVSLAGPGYQLWALSGGIPVPPVQGTSRSGVVVSAVLVRHDPVWAGQVMAHEIGHALGLYHTTEPDLTAEGVAVHDQLGDTPDCPAAVPGDDRTLTAAACEPFDAANLMFWATARGATTLTEAQGDIARRSALTR
jgi:hypothetical protein